MKEGRGEKERPKEEVVEGGETNEKGRGEELMRGRGEKPMKRGGGETTGGSRWGKKQ